MTVIHLGNNKYRGLSTDTKPTNVPDGAEFYETNTYNSWDMIAGTWTERSHVNAGARYQIYRVTDTLYKALNCATGIVKFKSEGTADVGALTNTVINDISFLGGRIQYSNDPFTIRTKISVPATQTGNQARPYIFEGQSDATSSFTGTVFNVGSGYTSGDYMFESIAAGGSGFTQNMHVRNMGARNPLATGSNGLNISGGAEKADAGFVNVESATHGTAGCPFSVMNCHLISMRKGIRVAGYIWFGKLNNLGFNNQNNKFLGDFCIKLENGVNHTVGGGVKGFEIQNIRTMLPTGTPGGGGDLGGSWEHLIQLCGGYHHVAHLLLDGATIKNDILALQQCYSSRFYNIHTMDTYDESNTGDATLVLDSVSPEGQAASGGYGCHNNYFTDCVFAQLGPNGKSIKFKNGAWRNHIQAAAYWGGILTIDDNDAGIQNVIELLSGHHEATHAATKISSTNNRVQIFDKRARASMKGIATRSGTGSTAAFTIAHSCFATPAYYYTYPLTPAAQAPSTVTVGVANITITFSSSPPSGTDNLKWAWYAEV